MRKLLLSALVVIGLSGAPAMAAETSAPVYPGAKPVEKTSPMATAIEASKQQMKQQQGPTAKVEAYAVPTGTTFANVREFYNTELSKAGWQTVTANEATPNSGSASWRKGDNSVLAISVIPNYTDQSAYIIIAENQAAQ